jgi:peptidyl-prolyl cis-trans isomerase SurA
MRFFTLNSRLTALALAAVSLVPFLAPARGFAQNIVVIVNDETITTYDIEQRTRWNALTTHNFGDQMKAVLTSEATNQKFKQMLMAAQPHSQEEAQAAAEKIKKQLIEEAKRSVMSSGGGTGRKAVIDALIEDRIKVQASVRLDVKVSDREVEESIEQRVAGEGADKKTKVTQFYQQFEANGISRKTVQDVFRAQLAWRNVIGRKYGPRLNAAMQAAADAMPQSAEGEVNYDVKILKLAVKDPSDQKALGERMLEAENLKEKFHSCNDLAKEAKLVANATVKSMDKAKLGAFPKDVQPLIEKVSDGQMTPPVLVGNAVETYAVCKKGVAAKPAAKTAGAKMDPRQAEYERYSRSFLQELKQQASIDHRGS